MLESSLSDDRSSQVVGRRTFFVVLGATLIGLVYWRYNKQAPAQVIAAPSAPPRQVAIVEFSDAGARSGIISVPKIEKSEAEWKKQLSPDSFEVTRHAE